jgi:recombination protein RecA
MAKKGKEIKKDLLDAIAEQGDKKYGKGYVSRLGSASVISRVVNTIATGSPGLDRVLARDVHRRYGIPVGRVVGVQGKEASGKTTLLIMIMRCVQHMRGIVRLYETEMAFDPEYAERCGVDVSEVIMSQPDYLEQMLNGIKQDIELFRQARIDYEAEYGEPWDVPMLIGVDSIAGTPPKAEYDAGGFEDEQARGLHARRLSKFFRWATKRVAKENVCLIMTNQTKVDINVTYGSKDTAIGGKALRFHASIMLELRKAGYIRPSKDADAVGILTEMKTTKNKCLPPFKKVIVPIMFGDGIDYNRALFMFLKENKALTKKGSYYSIDIMGKTIREQGEVKFVAALADFTRKKKVRRLLEGMVE